MNNEQAQWPLDAWLRLATGADIAETSGRFFDEVAARKRDAERYRWLRENCVWRWDMGDGIALVFPGESEPKDFRADCDAAIDEAMRKALNT